MKSWIKQELRFLIMLITVCFVSYAVAASGEVGHDHHGKGGHADSHTPGGEPPALIQIDTGSAPLKAGKSAEISFLITDRSGKAVEGLTISHERLLHVIIISEDFSSFAHIHPEDFGEITDEMKSKARFPVWYAFPKAGRYLISADTAVQDIHISNQFHVTVEGEPKAGAVVTDFSREKSFGEYDVSFKTVPEKIRVGEEITLRYEIRRNGEPVKELEQYLGAPMHLAVVMTDLNGFIHAHGDVPGSAHDHIHAGHIHGSARENFGPEIEAEVVFPKRGTYKIFSQVQHKGKVILLDFMVQVE
ncbi:MAG: hypothetical protein ACWGN7_02455 [Thermodesulfovibrionales bacterium]